jgi:hypothetical protein
MTISEIYSQKWLQSQDPTRDEKLIADAWKEEMDLNHEWWENIDVVEEPEVYKRQRLLAEQQRKGYITDKFFEPCIGEMFIEFSYENKVSNLVYIEDTKDKNVGIVIKSRIEAYKEQDKIIFNSSKIKKRFSYNNKTFLVLQDKDVLGIVQQ